MVDVCEGYKVRDRIGLRFAVLIFFKEKLCSLNLAATTVARFQKNKFGLLCSTSVKIKKNRENSKKILFVVLCQNYN